MVVADLDKKLAEYGLYWMEEPCIAENPENLAEIRADEFDGALEWCDANLEKHFKKAAKK